MIKRGTVARPGAARQPIYYGWIVVAALAVVGFTSVGMGVVNLGLFVKPMTEDLGVNQAFIGWAQTARLVAFAASSWMIGRMIDRHGPGWPLAVAGLLTGAAVAGLAFISAGWQMLVLFAIAGAAGVQGGGSASLFLSVPLTQWFVEKRGKALSLAFLGLPLGIFVLSPVSQVLIDTIGWRMAWLAIGTVGGVTITAIALVFLRRMPEDWQSPAGEAAPLAAGAGAGAAPAPSIEITERSWTRAEAVRSTTYWRLVGFLSLRTFCLSTMVVFRIPYFEDRGIDASVIAVALSAEAIASMVVVIPSGIAMDRFEGRYVAAVSIGFLALATIVTLNVSAPWHVFLATMFFGCGAASSAVIENAIWPSYFGSRNMGDIRGMAMPFALVVAAIGAPLTGMIKDVTGSFELAWYIALVGLGSAAILILVTRRPSPQIAL